LALKELLRKGKGVKGLGLPGELLFLVRTSLGLSSVLARLGARANWYQLLAGSLEAHAARMAQGLDTARAERSPARTGRVRTPPPKVPEGGPVAVRYDLVLVSPGQGVIDVVRRIRDVTGMSLRDVKDAVDRPPWTVRQAVPFAEAEALRQELEEVGAQVEVRPVN
jgi:ribosomal protein L7/L12